MDTRPIGIFDSGVGGLTVVKEIIKQLPNENIIYFGDMARVPYGTKSPEAVTRYSVEISDFLIRCGVKVIVVACNTASAIALKVLKKRYKIPVIGVIKPSVEKALATSKNGRIGVIGTETTIASRSYEIEIKKRAPKSYIVSKPCPMLVPLVEEGWLDGQITEAILRLYLKDLSTKRIDTLVLGCTHYPLLKNAIKKVMGTCVQIVDSADSVTTDLKTLLKKNGMLSNSTSPKRLYYVSDSPERFIKIGKIFLRSKFNDDVKKISL